MSFNKHFSKKKKQLIIGRPSNPPLHGTKCGKNLDLQFNKMN